MNNYFFMVFFMVIFHSEKHAIFVMFHWSRNTYSIYIYYIFHIFSICFFPLVISHRVYVPYFPYIPYFLYISYFPYIPYFFPLVIYFHMFFYSIVMMDFCHPPTSRPWVLTWCPSTCHDHRSGSVSSPPRARRRGSWRCR